MVIAFAHTLAAAAPASTVDLTPQWAGSRWLLAVEETTPSPVELSAEENFSFRTRALQVEAVLECPTAQAAGKQIDVACTLGAVALRATPRTLARNEALNPGNQKVLESIVARLQGQSVLLRVTQDGRVLTVDLPGLPAGTRRESDSREILRRVVFDLVAGFHLRRPADWQGGWQEKNTVLLRAPTQPGSSGLSQVTHSVVVVEGTTVVQAEGEGTFTSPYEPWEFSYAGRMSQRGSNSGAVTRDTSTSTSSTSSSSSPTAIDDGRLMGVGPTASSATPTDYTFTGTLSGVAVVDAETAFPIERVWATLGRPNASSIGNMQGLSVYYAGKLRRLGATESPTLGATEVVAPPGQSLEGLGVWVPITPQ
jgi:hypothetical protein